MNRERRINIKNGTDKKIIGGIKKAATAVRNAPKKIKRGINRAIDRSTDKVTDKIMKSKWWNS